MSNPLSDALAYLARWRNPYTQGAAAEWSSEEIAKGGYRLVMSPLRGGYPDGFDRDAEYLFLRRNWPEPLKFKLSDQPEWFNIAGLYWKPI